MLQCFLLFEYAVFCCYYLYVGSVKREQRRLLRPDLPWQLEYLEFLVFARVLTRTRDLTSYFIGDEIINPTSLAGLAPDTAKGGPRSSCWGNSLDPRCIHKCDNDGDHTPWPNRPRSS